MKKRILSLALALCMALSLCVPAAAAGTRIKDVALTMTALQLGKALPTDLKVSSPAGVSVTNVQWYGGESGKLSAGTKAETGKTYVIAFTLSVDKGTDAELGNSGVLQVTVNGEKALYTAGDKTSAQYQAVFYFEKPVEYAPEARPPAAENYDTFDYRAYANIYPDLKAAYGYNAEKLYAHYVNFGKAEGRVGTFISGDNPKTNAPIYGIAPIPKGATLPATLLDPLPPKDPAQQVKWSEETTNYLSWSNAKLVAEYYSMKGIMDGDQRWDYLTDITVYYWQSTLPDELRDRYDAAVENDPSFFSTHGDVYGRAKQSDTRILYQFFNGYKDFAPPPADPGKPGQPPAKTVGGFSDVTERDYFADPVVWAVERRITSGTGNGMFSPKQTCTQAQILTFLWHSQGDPEPAGTASLPGAAESTYYYKAALWAKEQGLIGEEFNAGAPCTRSMVVMYLWKRSGSPDAPAASFTDVPAAADYAPAVAWAVAQNITGGTGDGKFSPEQTCTRGQIVTFLYRAFAR